MFHPVCPESADLRMRCKVRELFSFQVLFVDLCVILPCRFHRVVALPGAEHVTKVLDQRRLVAVPHPGKHVALEMRHAALQRSPGELLSNHRVKPCDAVGHHQADALDTALFQLVKYPAPSGGALNRHVEDAKHFPRAVFRHRQGDVERFRRHRPATVDLDVDAVHEHDGIVPVKAAFQPLADLRPDAFDHPADARLGIVLAVDLIILSIMISSKSWRPFSFCACLHISSEICSFVNFILSLCFRVWAP